MMLRVTPFAALRPADDLLSIVATPDQVRAERAEIEPLLRNDPFTILHVLRPEMDLAPGAARKEVLAQAAQAFTVFREHEIVMQDRVPCVYLYQLEKGDHVRAAVVLGCAFENVEEGLLKAEARAATMREEEIMAWEELLEATNAQFRPVSIAHADHPGLDALVAEVLMMSPLSEVTTPEDGVTHRLWGVPGEALAAFFEAAFAALPGGVVVDGFEELEALLRLREKRRARQEEEPPFFMAAFFPASQMGLGPAVHGNGGRLKLELCAGLLTLAFPFPTPALTS